MTSWAAVSHFEVLEAIKSFEICEENGKVKSKSNPIWKEICSLWKTDTGQFRMKPVNLYFYITKDRNAIFTSYIKCKNVIEPDVEENVTVTKSLSGSDDSEFSGDDENDPDFTLHSQRDDHPCKNKVLIFTIKFSAEIWVLLKPIQKMDKSNRPYLTLQTNWTHKLADLVYNETKLPCAFSFRSNKVFNLDSEGDKNNENNYRVKVSGFCVEKNCRAAIYGECNYSDNDNIAQMTFYTLNTNEIAHFKKRYVSSGRRTEMKKELKNKKSAIFREELILKFQEYGDQISPLIPSTKVLNEVKQEAEKEDFGIIGNLWENLTKIKYGVEFCSTLRQIGFDKFFAFYWSPEQIDIYNDVIKLNPIVSIDATGSLVRKINDHGRLLNGPIFLYQMVTYIDNFIVLIF